MPLDALQKEDASCPLRPLPRPLLYSLVQVDLFPADCDRVGWSLLSFSLSFHNPEVVIDVQMLKFWNG
jgi:hypothetical protein